MRTQPLTCIPSGLSTAMCAWRNIDAIGLHQQSARTSCDCDVKTYLSRRVSQPAAAPALSFAGSESVPLRPASAATGTVTADRQKVAVPE